MTLLLLEVDGGGIGRFHPALLLPLLTGFLYALAAVMVKKGMQEGIGPWRTTFITNLSMGVLCLPLLLFPGGEFPGWSYLYQPVLAALAFFLGQIFTFLALSRGDVSVATPLMGTKILFVALFSLLFLEDPITLGLWVSAVLAAVAVFLLGAQSPANPSRIGVTILYALTSAGFFGCTDVLLQRWVGGWGFSTFLPVVFVCIALFSFAFVPFFRGGFRQLPRAAWKWALPGTVLLAGQSIILAIVLGTIGKATEVNILYSTRGLWSIALIWFVGHWFGNLERDVGYRVFVRRFLGAFLLVIAIALVATGT